ncbi:MAG TPA: dNTP triphosphohydrolase, partial [Aliidiomarina sp.]|nr:dNTP triphosphohydrolase [Aliidiomarina sp.]
HLQKLNLTYAQAACILKYTRVGTEQKPKTTDQFYYLKKKPGYYQSEAAYVEKLQQALAIKPGHRYPLTYIMEAADDISYCLADLEDGVDKGLLSYQELADLLINEFQTLRQANQDAEHTHFKGQSFAQLMQKALALAAEETVDKEHAFFVNFRVGLIHPLVQHAAKTFVNNITEVYEGSLKRALLEDHSPEHAVIQSLKNVAARVIFKAREVETLELQGHQIIVGILDQYLPLLRLKKDEFEQLVAETKSHFLIENHLFRRLPEKYVKAYTWHCAQIEEEHAVWELYYRCRLIQDMVSGMTDQLALDEYQTLTVTRHY